MKAADLARVLRAMAEAGAAELERLEAEGHATRADWRDQSTSPLGRRRHCAAVRARVARGAAGAAVVGRRCLLSEDALLEELQALPGRNGEPNKAGGVGFELRKQLAVLSGGRR